MRFLFWFLALVFVAFAALQLNDPDPWVWAPLYLVPAAAMAWTTAARPLPPWLAWALAAGYAGLAWWWWPARFDGVTGPMTPHTTVEECREALGLLICAICLALAGQYARRAARLRRPARPPGKGSGWCLRETGRGKPRPAGFTAREGATEPVGQRVKKAEQWPGAFYFVRPLVLFAGPAAPRPGCSLPAPAGTPLRQLTCRAANCPGPKAKPPFP